MTSRAKGLCSQEASSSVCAVHPTKKWSNFSFIFMHCVYIWPKRLPLTAMGGSRNGTLPSDSLHRSWEIVTLARKDSKLFRLPQISRTPEKSIRTIICVAQTSEFIMTWTAIIADYFDFMKNLLCSETKLLRVPK